MTIRILQGDARERLAELPDASVHCCVTSPPYFGLRDYGVEGQIGLEETPEAYVAELVGVFREVRRVLRPDATCWINLGDSYNAHPGQRKVTDKAGAKQQTNAGSPGAPSRHTPDLKAKDLLGIPWRVAFALQADGWWLRQDIIWSKPNPMPESVTDRFTKAHEYLFLLSKSGRYWFDAAAVSEVCSDKTEWTYAQPDKAARAGQTTNGTGASTMRVRPEDGKRNKRSVWTVATQPFTEAHFATFPPDLIEPAILAGTSEKGCCSDCGAPWVRHTRRVDQGYNGSKYGERAVAASGGAKTGGTAKSTLGSSNGKATGYRLTEGWEPSCPCFECSDAKVIPCTVLDPFGGAGTTGLVADRLGRNAILIELNHAYADMARRRIEDDAPLLAEVG